MGYQSPPIVEAVVQLTFESGLDIAEVDAVADKLARIYANRSNRNTITATFDTLKGEVNGQSDRVGVELKDDSATNVLLIDLGMILFSVLAPYPGWEDFERRIETELTKLKDVVGPKKLSRLGMRFVNRIDVPATNGVVDFGKYVLSLPKYESPYDTPVTGFLVQVSQQLPIESGMFSLTCAATESPLLGFHGIAVDIDVGVSRTMSLNVPRVIEILREMREAKNRIFESVVSDESRVIFGDNK